MNSKELLEKYPLVADVIREHFKKKFVEGATDQIKEIFGEYTPDDETLANLTEGSPRTLFDVFDENSVYIITLVSTDGKFKWGIQTDLASLGGSDYVDTRKMAEERAVEEAFKILNEKLCQTK